MVFTTLSHAPWPWWAQRRSVGAACKGRCARRLWARRRRSRLRWRAGPHPGTLKMPTAGLGRRADAECRGRPEVNAFAAGLEASALDPRAAQRRRHRGRGAAAGQRAHRARCSTDAMRATMRRARRGSASPITLTLRDADGDGAAEQRYALLGEPRPALRAWRCSATPSTSATPTACWPSWLRRARAHRR